MEENSQLRTQIKQLSDENDSLKNIFERLKAEYNIKNSDQNDEIMKYNEKRYILLKSLLTAKDRFVFFFIALIFFL